MAVQPKKGIIAEFRDFAMRGSVVDLAVGIIIGGAFQKIVNSLVNDVIMPLIGWILGDIDFSNLFIVLGKIPEDAIKSQLSSLTYVRDTLGIAVFAYGSFITSIINFAIMAFVIFLLVKGINKLKSLNDKSQDAADPVPTLKTCEFCKSKIPATATKCPQCTSELKN